jgi:hypothetical protein
MDENVVLSALDVLGKALADSGHVWTREERRLYERACSALAEREYITDDLVLPELTLDTPCRIRVVVSPLYVRLYVGKRDWEWDRETGEWVGQGTDISEA